MVKQIFIAVGPLHPLAIILLEQPMRKHVYIDPTCLVASLIPSALEEYHKEISGYLIGSNGQSRRFKVVSAYSLQSVLKKRTWVEHGNASAIKRIDSLMKTLKMRVVGGFHTHPGGPHKLSRSDLEFIRETMARHELPSWLEVIVAVKKKEYASRQKLGWQLQALRSKMGMRVKATPWEGFAVTLSGYWVRPRGAPKEATLWTSKRYKF